jgi:DNA (cytosine-5)-methyltransferase 1
MKLIFAEIMRELKASGYQVSARLLNAAYYGVPQRRERVIFIGVRSNLGVAPSHPLGSSSIITVKEALQGCTPSEIVPLFGKNLQKMQMIRPGATYREKRRAAMAVFGKMGGFTFNRIKWSAPAPTILKTVSVSATFGAGLVMPDENRYVSISELKRLGSFPDQFLLEGSFEERWARIGNSVPPLLMRAVALHIRNVILAKVNSPAIMSVAA